MLRSMIYKSKDIIFAYYSSNVYKPPEQFQSTNELYQYSYNPNLV